MINLGSTSIVQASVGDTAIVSIARGDTELWSASTGYTFSNTVSWGDEFDYSGSPDIEKWGLDEGNGYSGWGNNQQQYYTNRTDNANVSGGTLSIIAKNETFSGFSYTSAQIKTTYKKMFQYGRFDIRAKLPVTGGMWPAIYLFGETWKNYDYSKWPESGEIDVMELNGNNPGTVLGTIHTGYYNYQNGTGSSNSADVADADEYHNYRIDWTPDYIRWFLDDVQFKEFLNDGGDHSHWPFDDYCNFFIYLAVGGGFVGTIDSGILPQKMEIDYVRYYQLLGGHNTPEPVRPATPTFDVAAEVTKTQSAVLTINALTMPPNCIIKAYSMSTPLYVGTLGENSFEFPAILPPELGGIPVPLGVYEVFAVAEDITTGVQSIPVKTVFTVIAD